MTATGDDSPERRYAEVTTVENGVTTLVIYDTENPTAWVQSTRSYRLEQSR